MTGIAAVSSLKIDLPERPKTSRRDPDFFHLIPPRDYGHYALSQARGGMDEGQGTLRGATKVTRADELAIRDAVECHPTS